MFDTYQLKVWTYGKYASNVFSFHLYNKSLPESWRIYSVYFLRLFPKTFSASSSKMMLSFLVNLKDYYHKHDIENFFHDHIHGYETILHSLQGMTQIQMDWEL